MEKNNKKRNRARSQSEIIKDVAAGTGVSNKIVKQVFEVLTEVVEGDLVRYGSCTMPGVGKLRLKVEPPRLARNPRTGAKVQTQKGVRVLFTARENLKTNLLKKCETPKTE